MYEGKQPVYVIVGFLFLLVVLGGFLFMYTRDEGYSALTGSTVIPVPEEQPSLETSPVVTGSVQTPFDTTGKEFVDEKLGEEFQVGLYLMKVIYIKAVEKIGDYVTPEQFQGAYADKMFYAVQVQITNVGLNDGYAPLDMFYLSDGTSLYGIDEEATKFFGPESILYAVLRTGVKRHVKFAFDVEPRMYDLFISADGQTIYRVTFSE